MRKASWPNPNPNPSPGESTTYPLPLWFSFCAVGTNPQVGPHSQHHSDSVKLDVTSLSPAINPPHSHNSQNTKPGSTRPKATINGRSVVSLQCAQKERGGILTIKEIPREPTSVSLWVITTTVRGLNASLESEMYFKCMLRKGKLYWFNWKRIYIKLKTNSNEL